jgi:uncharacterized membrane protein
VSLINPDLLLQAWPAAALGLMACLILLAQRHTVLRPVFRRLPVPLWCYGLPLAAVELGWLPAPHPAYASLADGLLPIALALLLLGTDLAAVRRMGGRVLVAMAAGVAGLVLGAALGGMVLQSVLPPEAWKGIGALAATWSGGTMNLLALRALLAIPDGMVASLIVVDALLTYSWMALLIAGSGCQPRINAWLGATDGGMAMGRGTTTNDEMTTDPGAAPAALLPPQAASPPSSFQHEWHGWGVLACGGLAIAVARISQALARELPTGWLIGSATGWTMLLVTTGALGLSLSARVRRLGCHGSTLGYFCLYLVLSATGAQARLGAVGDALVWLALGLGMILVHGGVLLAAGRLLRLPVGLLATASQAAIGGLVSGPLVGAVYHPTLAPVGLLLAVLGNAVGTYVGLLAASLLRPLLSAM